MDKLLQIKGEVIAFKNIVSSEIEIIKKELDTAMSSVNYLEGKWNPILFTDTKESFQNAQTRTSAVLQKVVALQKSINLILRSA